MKGMKHKDDLNCKNTNFTSVIISSFKNLYFLISDHLYLCDFAKRCPLSFRLNMGITCVQARVAGKKQRVAVLLGVSREPRPRPICGWVAELFCVKPIGVGRGDFVTLIRV